MSAPMRDGPRQVTRLRKAMRAPESTTLVSLDNLINAVTIDRYRDPLGRLAGQPLDPTRHTAEMLKSIFINMGPRETAAVWQQTPRAAEGALFNRAFFSGMTVPKDSLPPGLRWSRFWDWAYSEEQVNKGDPDYTVGAKVAFLFDEDWQSFTIYLGHIVRARKSWSDVKKLVAQTAAADAMAHGSTCYQGGEAGGPQKGACDDILKMAAMAAHTFWAFPTDKDKVAKAQPWMDRARVGMMLLVEGEWHEEFFDEGESFPNGLHDDIVDAISGAYNMCAGRAQTFDVSVKKQQDLLRPW